MRYPILLITLLLLNCSSEEFENGERLKITVNGKLAVEYIYSGNQLIQETAYAMQAGAAWASAGDWTEIDEVYRYYYRPDSQVDYIDVYSLGDRYLRREQYEYDDHAKLIGIVHTIQNDHVWVSHFDYHIQVHVPRKKGDIVQYSKSTISCRWDFDVCWSWDAMFSYDDKKNISKLYFATALIEFEYDDHSNPIYEFGSTSRMLPIRMSANNPVKVTYNNEGRLHHIIVNEYQYDGAGRPILAIRKNISNPGSKSDTVEYHYDKARI